MNSDVIPLNMETKAGSPKKERAAAEKYDALL